MKTPAHYAWLLFALATLAYIPVPFHRFSPAIVAADIMKDMGLSAPAMGVLASSFFVVYGIMQMPGGLLVDGIGSRRLMPLMVGVSGLGALCFGMADSFWLALLGRSIIGFGTSITFLCGMQIIGQYFPVQQFGRLSGLFLGMGGVGLFMAFGPLAALCLAVGRETAFMLCGAATIGLALLMVVLMRGGPERSQKAAGFELMKRNLRVVMTRRDFWFACVWLFAQSNLHMSFPSPYQASREFEENAIIKTGCDIFCRNLFSFLRPFCGLPPKKKPFEIPQFSFYPETGHPPVASFAHV